MGNWVFEKWWTHFVSFMNNEYRNFKIRGAIRVQVKKKCLFRIGQIIPYLRGEGGKGVYCSSNEFDHYILCNYDSSYIKVKKNSQMFEYLQFRVNYQRLRNNSTLSQSRLKWSFTSHTHPVYSLTAQVYSAWHSNIV